MDKGESDIAACIDQEKQERHIPSPSISKMETEYEKIRRGD